MEIRGDVRATPQAAPSRPGSRPGEEVLGLLGHVAIGAGKGTAIGAGVATACGATGPGAPACMAAAAVYGGYSLWRDRQKLLSDPYEAAETIGTFATVVPSAKFTRAQLASVPEHALYSGPKGRTVGELRAAGMKDAHHVIQDAAVRDRPGYDTNAAPGVQLPGPANTPGTPHHAATTVQRQAGGGTYAAERRIGYKALRKAGVSVAESRGLIQSADAYFGKLGVTPSTPTRVPKNRAKSR